MYGFAQMEAFFPGVLIALISVHWLETNLDTKTPEAHVKRSILVRTVETRDGEVGAGSHCTSHVCPLGGNIVNPFSEISLTLSDKCGF